MAFTYIGDILQMKETEPEFLVLSWKKKPEVTSGQFRILPVLQLLLTRTNQETRLCRCGLSPGFVWGQVGVEGKGVAKYSS